MILNQVNPFSLTCHICTFATMRPSRSHLQLSSCRYYLHVRPQLLIPHVVYLCISLTYRYGKGRCAVNYENKGWWPYNLSSYRSPLSRASQAPRKNLHQKIQCALGAEGGGVKATVKEITILMAVWTCEARPKLGEFGGMPTPQNFEKKKELE